MSITGQINKVHPPKRCVVCGGEYWKPTKISLAQWAKREFCSNACRGVTLRSRERVMRDGRVKVWTESGLRWRYHVIAEAKLGRPLRPGEVVDHINGNCADDRPENLRVFASHSEHMAAHWAEGRMRKPCGPGGSVAVYREWPQSRKEAA